MESKSIPSSAGENTGREMKTWMFPSESIPSLGDESTGNEMKSWMSPSKSMETALSNQTISEIGSLEMNLTVTKSAEMESTSIHPFGSGNMESKTILPIFQLESTEHFFRSQAIGEIGALEGDGTEVESTKMESTSIIPTGDGMGSDTILPTFPLESMEVAMSSVGGGGGGLLEVDLTGIKSAQVERLAVHSSDGNDSIESEVNSAISLLSNVEIEIASSNIGGKTSEHGLGSLNVILNHVLDNEEIGSSLASQTSGLGGPSKVGQTEVKCDDCGKLEPTRIWRWCRNCERVLCEHCAVDGHLNLENSPAVENYSTAVRRSDVEFTRVMEDVGSMAKKLHDGNKMIEQMKNEIVAKLNGIKHKMGKKLDVSKDIDTDLMELLQKMTVSKQKPLNAKIWVEHSHLKNELETLLVVAKTTREQMETNLKNVAKLTNEMENELNKNFRE